MVCTITVNDKMKIIYYDNSKKHKMNFTVIGDGKLSDSCLGNCYHLYLKIDNFFKPKFVLENNGYMPEETFDISENIISDVLAYIIKNEIPEMRD